MQPIALVKWDESQHPRDKEGQFTVKPVAITENLATHPGMEMVAVKDLVEFQTQDRRVDPKSSMNITEPTEKLLPRLTQELREGVAIQEPLTLAYDTESGLMLLVDGNTRLAAITDAGFTHAPVVISRQNLHGFGASAKKLSSAEAGIEPFRNWLLPSEAGFATLRKKWDESQHPRDQTGKFRGKSNYAPDHDAPKEGEWDWTGVDRSDDPKVQIRNAVMGIGPKWRQQHHELVHDAIQAWVGSPDSFRIHVQDALIGAPQPDSGGGKQMRAQAEALLWELENNPIRTPTLYRGSGMRGDIPGPGAAYSWTERRQHAANFAKRYGGIVEVLPAGARGIRVKDYAADAFNEDHWIVRAGNDPVRVKAAKDPASGRYVTPFVSFDKQGDEQLRMIASLNSSRLATWGFTAEAEVLGMARYRLTAVLDGRTSKFCRMIDGKIFDVTDAREKVIEVLNVQDPNDLRVVQPWPRQDKLSMAMYSEMSAEELTERGLHIPPYHPHCRTLCRSVESSKGKSTEVTATVPAEVEVFQPVTAEDLKEIGVIATPEQVAEWNANIGMSPVELMTKLTGERPQDVMTQGVGSKPVEFHPSGDIGLNARGVTDGLEFKLGAILDPFTGIFYLTRAELEAGTPKAEASFLKRMFSAMLEMGKKSTASSIALSVAGNAAYYAKLGFLPDELEWDDLRHFSLAEVETGALQPMMASLAPADALLVKQLLQDASPSALVALAELPFTYAGKTVGEWILGETAGIWALDLVDDLMVAQAKAYVS